MFIHCVSQYISAWQRLGTIYWVNLEVEGNLLISFGWSMVKINHVKSGSRTSLRKRTTVVARQLNIQTSWAWRVVRWQGIVWKETVNKEIVKTHPQQRFVIILELRLAWSKGRGRRRKRVETEPSEVVCGKFCCRRRDWLNFKTVRYFAAKFMFVLKPPSW